MKNRILWNIVKFLASIENSMWERHDRNALHLIVSDYAHWLRCYAIWHIHHVYPVSLLTLLTAGNWLTAAQRDVWDYAEDDENPFGGGCNDAGSPDNFVQAEPSKEFIEWHATVYAQWLTENPGRHTAHAECDC